MTHCLTQYEAVRHLFCLHLPQYESHLPRHEVVVRNVFLRSLRYICMLVVFSDVSGLQLKKISDGFKKANIGFVVSDLFVWPWWFLQLYTSLRLHFNTNYAKNNLGPGPTPPCPHASSALLNFSNIKGKQGVLD
ncbi:hypothetical protein YC2023_052386 [Brassica napus]